MKKVFILATLAAILLASCEKVKDATSKDITVEGVEFKFSEKTVSGISGTSMMKSATTNSTFNITREVDISELSDSEVIEYANKIKKVKINSSLLKVTMSVPGVFKVTDFEIYAKDVGSFSISDYTVGEELVPSKEMNAYMAEVIKKLLNTKKLEVTVKGKTDAPAGTTVTVSYKNDIVFTVSLL